MAIQVYQSFSAYYHRTALIILLIGFLVRLTIAICLNPGFDEAYYYLSTLHPDWSYFDHPPLVTLTTGIGLWLTGQVSQFTIRIGTLLLYTGSLLFLYLATLRLYTLQIAINTLAIASVIPIFQIAFGVLSTPDTPLLFFWSMSLWLAVQEFFDYRGYRPSFRLTLLCFAVGLACLSKYHGFVLGLGFIGFCLFSRNYRPALTSKWFSIGIMIFLVTISPILFWNINHGWASFHLQLNNNKYLLDSLLETLRERLGGILSIDLLYLFPAFGVPLLWAIIRAFVQQLRNIRWGQFIGNRGFKDEWELEKRGLILWLSLPLILGFTLISGDRQMLPSAQMSGYWTATILLAERVSIERRNAAVRIPYRWFFGSLAVVILLSSIALSHVTLGTLQASDKPSIFGLLPISTDPSTQIFDIQQLRQGLVDNNKLNLALKNADFVFTNRYYLGGQIGMAIEPVLHKPITCFDADLRSFAFWSKPQQWIGKNAIYLSTKTAKVDLDATNIYSSYFEEITKLGEIPIRRGGVVIQTFSIYQAQNMLKPFPRPYGN
jgi:4-amino-4-deoxy-L-arabinose transferase-like glycosyltransferase